MEVGEAVDVRVAACLVVLPAVLQSVSAQASLMAPAMQMDSVPVSAVHCYANGHHPKTHRVVGHATVHHTNCNHHPFLATIYFLHATLHRLVALCHPLSCSGLPGFLADVPLLAFPFLLHFRLVHFRFPCRLAFPFLLPFCLVPFPCRFPMASTPSPSSKVD